MYVYEPSDGHGLRHDPFVAIVAPRPIGWISTQGVGGGRNLAPYSFFNAFNYRPPIIGFSSIGWKDTLRNAQETGVVVWNLATRALAERMNQTSARYAYSEDEFVRAGVTPEPGRLVNAPRVAESPVAFECKVSQIVAMRTAAGRTVDTWVVFGEVVAVQINEDLICDGVYDKAGGAPIMRGGGTEEYFTIGAEQRFAIARPCSRLSSKGQACRKPGSTVGRLFPCRRGLRQRRRLADGHDHLGEAPAVRCPHAMTAIDQTSDPLAVPDTHAFERILCDIV